MTTIDEIESLITVKHSLEKDIQFFESKIEKNRKLLDHLMEKLEHLFEKHAEETEV